MTTLGSACLLAFALLVSGWILNLVRRGRMYVGYGIVVLLLLAGVAAAIVTTGARDLTVSVLAALFPGEPLAIVGLAALLLLLVYVLHQLSVLSDRVARLTQEIAIRNATDRNSRAGESHE